MLMTHVARVDTVEGYSKLHYCGVCDGTPFFLLFQSEFSSASVDSYGERARFGSGDRCGMGAGFDGGE